MVCQVDAVPPVLLAGASLPAEPSATVRERVLEARERQHGRLRGTGAMCNADMDGPLTRRHVAVGRGVRSRLLGVPDPELLSGRGHDRVLRVARTIADLAGRGRIHPEDVDESLGYRSQATWAAAA
jgi:magnesium chelatase family protein